MVIDNGQHMNIGSFLALAAKFEHEAVMIYRKAVEVINAVENPDAAAFFREMAGYSNLHFLTAMERAGFSDISELPQSGSQWDSSPAPESLDPMPSIGDIIDLNSAMTLALSAEHRAMAFYDSVARISSDLEVKVSADEFANEERGHILALERFMGLKPY